jgi:CRISPR-associated protein Cmr2
MTREVDWLRKTQAILYPYPPDAVFDPSTRVQRSQLYLEAAGVNAHDLLTITDAHEIAFALDIPACIRQSHQDDLFLANPCVIHPLSGQREPLQLEATDDLKQRMTNAVKRFAGIAGDPRNQFLALWRFLPNITRETVPEQWQPYWNLLPAEPTSPAHSVWEHTSLASAVAGTWNPEAGCHDPALLMFTISSAQELLLTSRRTQDLWMGSYLLSWLTWKAIEVVASQIGPDSVIYPDLRGQPLLDYWLHSRVFSSEDQPWRDLAKASIWDDKRGGLAPEMRVANLPNMFTALVPRTSATGIAEDAVRAVQGTWETIARSVKTRLEQGLPNLANDKVWQQFWEEPVKSFLQDLGMFWATYPLSLASDGHDLKESVYNAVKACEDWIQPEEGKNREKQWQDYKQLLRASKDSLNVGMVYYPVSRLAARALTNRKSLRDFKQQSAPGEKCSLCGTRTALHPVGASKYHDLRKFWRDLSRVDKRIDDGSGSPKLKLAGRIRKGDHLCGSCLTRRLAWEQHFLAREFAGLLPSNSKLRPEEHILFPSTSSMATASFKQQVLLTVSKGNSSSEESDRLATAVSDYNEQLMSFLRYNDILYPSADIPAFSEMPGDLAKNFNLIDGEWLYEESFDVDGICREYDLTCAELLGDAQSKSKLDSAREAAAILRDVTKKTLGIAPSRYYAVLAMDGDNMGQWVSGQKPLKFAKLLHPDVTKQLKQDTETEQVLDSDRPLGAALHVALSTALKNFSLECVRPILETERSGRLIYAGGDDLLALLPVADVLNVLRSLRYLFSGTTSNANLAPGISDVRNGFATITDQYGKKTRLRMMGSSSTISAGVAIVHHKHPFSHAIEMAHTALKEDAKEQFGRDAFVIRLSKRSGEPLLVGAKWTDKHNKHDRVDTIELITCAIQEGALSPILARDLLNETAGMQRCSNEAQQAELSRLVARHVRSAADREHVEVLLGNLLKGLSEEMKDDAWRQIANVILLARFLAGEAYHE